jgi:hypothetical protein
MVRAGLPNLYFEVSSLKIVAKAVSNGIDLLIEDGFGFFRLIIAVGAVVTVRFTLSPVPRDSAMIMVLNTAGIFGPRALPIEDAK